MYEQLFEKLSEVTEEVAIEDPQKVMKDYYKGKSTKLALSTWHSEREANWYKFWILTDGTVIPVKRSHLDTALDAGLHSGRPLLDVGVVRGHIDNSTKELDVDIDKKFTRNQIFALKNFYVEYKVTYIFVGKMFGRKDFESSIESSAQLDYLLTYGKDVDEAKSEEDEKEQFFVDRTNKHIGLVQDAAAKIVKAYPEFDKLLTQVKVHDASKLKEPERVPYVEITWRHKLENEKGEYDPYNGKGYQTPGQLKKEEENTATVHHITTNSHHPEYHLKDKSDANVDMADRSKSELVDASRMPDIDVAEMVADWQAMSEELQTNTTREWFDKQKDVRWHFSEHQEELIDKLLKVFENEDE